MDTHTLVPDISCAVVPRRGASSEELKGLGAVLAEWSENELAQGGLLHSIDNIVLAELMGGDDPSEFVFAVLYGDTNEDCLTITRRTPGHSDPAAAAENLVVACAFRGPAYDRRRAVASLRAAVPAELVEDVLLDGRSWNAAE